MLWRLGIIHNPQRPFHNAHFSPFVGGVATQQQGNAAYRHLWQRSGRIALSTTPTSPPFVGGVATCLEGNAAYRLLSQLSGKNTLATTPTSPRFVGGVVAFVAEVTSKTTES